jgi:hypothetical protein
MDSPRLGPLSSCAPWRLLTISLCLFGLLGACGDDSALTSTSYRLLGPPAFADGCPSIFAPSPVAFDTPPTSARFTYRRTSGELVCDAVISNTGDPPVIAVPSADGEILEVYVELFSDISGTNTLLGTGIARADLATAGAIDILITPREQFSCALDQIRDARAFHTATALPDGRVLVVGGLVADPTGDTDIVNTDSDLYVTASVELYDPETGRFSAVSIPGLTPRAFHQALPLASGDVALLGGITVGNDPLTTVAASVGGDYRIEPTAEALAAGPQVVRYDPETLSVTLVTTPDLDMLTPRIFAGASTDLAVSTTKSVIAGGVPDGDPMSARLLSFDLVDPTSGTARPGGDLVVSRIGATVTGLADGSALVWGGNIGSPAVDTTIQAGELITGLGEAETPASMLMGYSVAGDLPTPRLFHAAARAGDGSVIVAGGYGIDPMLASETLDGVFAQRIVASGTATVTTLQVLGGGAAEPAVYVDAVALADGDILLSGGSPAIGVGVCPDTAKGLLCVTADAYRYGVDGGALEVPDAPMLIGRYGHRNVVLDNGTVLVTGGFGTDGITLRVLADAEVFDPREEEDDPLAPLAPAVTRLPGDIARASGEPFAECTLIETVVPE